MTFMSARDYNHFLITLVEKSRYSLYMVFGYILANGLGIRHSVVSNEIALHLIEHNGCTQQERIQRLSYFPLPFTGVIIEPDCKEDEVNEMIKQNINAMMDSYHFRIEHYKLLFKYFFICVVFPVFGLVNSAKSYLKLRNPSDENSGESPSSELPPITPLYRAALKENLSIFFAIFFSLGLADCLINRELHPTNGWDQCRLIGYTAIFSAAIGHLVNLYTISCQFSPMERRRAEDESVHQIIPPSDSARDQVRMQF